MPGIMAGDDRLGLGTRTLRRSRCLVGVEVWIIVRDSVLRMCDPGLSIEITPCL